MDPISSRSEFRYYGALLGTVGLVASWMFLFPRESATKRLPPAPNMGFFSFMKQFLGTLGHDFALKVARSVGNVYRVPGITNPCVVMIGDPVLARQILEDPAAEKPLESYIFFCDAVGGETFFSLNGPRALHVRKSTAAAFAPSSIKAMAAVVESVVEKWIETRLEPIYVQTGTPLDFDSEMMLVTTEIIAKSALAYDLSNEDLSDLSQKLYSIISVFFRQRVNPIRKYFGFLFADIREATRNAKDLTAKLGMSVLDASRKNPEANPLSIPSLMLKDLDYKNDEERARDIMIYFFAGSETTTHSIAWTVLELARNPSEQTKLRTALQEFEKENKQSDLLNCPQLKYVIRETLRLHTPAPLGSIRTATKDMPIPDSPNNAIIPKGSTCWSILHMLLRNTTVFGSNADSFVPSRWENPTEDMQRAYLPFAAGKRNCQGQALANLELQTVLSKLSLKYKLELVEEGEPSYMVTLSLSGSKILVSRL